MYSVKLTIGSTTLNLDRAHNYTVATISGLTGLSARLSTVQDSEGLGEVYTDGSIGGRQVIVSGLILDNDGAAKRTLIDTILPLSKGTMTIVDYPTLTGLNLRPEDYRTIDFIVATAPQITQEYHAKYAFALYCPQPFWKDATATSIALTPGAGVTATVKGQFDTDYDLSILIPANTHLAEYLVAVDYQQAGQKRMYLNFRKLTAGYVGDEDIVRVYVTRRDGRLTVTMQDSGGTVTDIMKVLNTNYDFLKLPLGEHSFICYPRDENGNDLSTIVSAITYYAKYSGVAISGL